MAQTVHRSTSEPLDPAFHAIRVVDPNNDITSQLASRISELYASEELHQRKERADRIIRRAAAPVEE
jgi:hypothetical protein